MKCLFCCLISLFALSYLHAQSAADLTYLEIDSLLYVYHAQPAEYADAGIQLALEASRLTGEEDSLCGEYLEWACALYAVKGNGKNGIEYCEKARRIFEKTNGEHSARYADILSHMGGLQVRLGNADEALPLLVQAKNTYQNVLGSEHPNYASSINSLAALYQTIGDYDQALLLAIQAKNIYQKVLGVEHPYFAQLIANLASLYQMIGDYDKALPLLVQAKNSYQKIFGAEHPLYANSINSLALLYKAMGDYDKALPLLVQAKNIRQKILGAEHPHFAASISSLGSLYKTMEQYEKALPLLIQAKNIRQKTLGVENMHFAASASNLGSLYQTMGNYDKALPLLIQAKNIYQKILGTDHPYFAASINKLADLHENMEAYPEAWDCTIQALKASSNHPISATVSPSWADTLLRTTFSSNIHTRQTILTLKTIYSLLQVDTAIQQPTRKQLIVADLATALLAKYRNNVSSDKDKLRLLDKSNDWLQKSLTNLHSLDQAPKAFALADQNKSVLLLQATRSEQAYRLGDLPDSIVWQDRKLYQQQSQLQAQLSEQRTQTEKDSLRSTLNDINQAIDALEAQIKTNHPKYYQLKYAQPTVDAEQVQALLDDHTALLEYVLSDSALHIFCITKKTIVWKKVAVTKKIITHRIQQLHEVLSDGTLLNSQPKGAYQRYTQDAHWFYQQLLAPVLDGQTGLKQLVIITDGELGHLPFEAFLTKPAPAQVTNYGKLPYLVNDYTFSYNYSAVLWQENLEAPQPVNNGQLFGLAANYDLELDSSLWDLRLPTDQWARARLSALPGARREVEVLQDHYQGFFAFDSLASERVVKANVGDFAVLHFAVHGLLDERRPMLSSLALSEDNDSTESNFWQAHEISKLPLQANLVVLSACETGYGAFEQGNGIASLARAFMYAGAPSLVVSLWQVNDYATAQIMQHFYANIAEGMRVDEALRQAKLTYLEKAAGPAAHPMFWSAFIHIGKTEPVALKTKGGHLWWWLGGVAGLVLLGVFAWRVLKRV